MLRCALTLLWQHMKSRHTELLAPAGNMQSLHAAVTAGADAVYLGLNAFNARRAADNFTLETLSEACDYAHLRGVQVYLTLNIAVLPSEVCDVYELARQAYRRGVDAFIVQDVGVAAQLKELMPNTELHISTQMNIHSKAGIEAACELGASRVTLARELSITEIAHLAKHAQNLGMEVEVFAHGALCICYSGQCFMSSMIGGRSANRGQCAQACRLPYELHNKALRKGLDAPGEHLLSPKDLCALDLILPLCEAGVTSFKLEGRMKSSEYVYTVTSVYRKALDRALTETAPVTSDAERTALAEVFSRGFTTAYLEGERGNDMMSYGRPNNRGVFIGRVVSAQGSEIRVSTNEHIVEGDVLEFWTNKGHFAHVVAAGEGGTGEKVRFAITKRLAKGDRVFRVRSAHSAFVDDAYAPRIPVDGSVLLRKDEPLTIVFTAQSDPAISVRKTGVLVEAARTKTISAEEVREHIDRFGNTPFMLGNLTIDLEEGVGIGFSQLHKLRSEALQELTEAMLAPYHDRVLVKTDKSRSLMYGKTYSSSDSRGTCKVVAWASNPACARAAKRAGAEAIYVPALFYKRGQAIIAGQLSDTAESAGYPKQSILALPVVDHDQIEGTREFIQDQDVWQYVNPQKPVLVENVGQLVRAQALGALPEVGPHIPVLNRDALAKVQHMGARQVWLSPELSLTQIEELGERCPVPLGLTIIGSQEVMTTEHCLLMSQGPCNQECASCARRKSPHYLKDRKGYEFPVITDGLGRSHLYNAVSFDIAHMLPELISAGISSVMVDTTVMNVAETKKAVERAVRARDIAHRCGDHVSKAEGATTGHIFRGVS